ncbi:aromatic amino acid transport family protein [Shigella flexneri]
MFSNSAVASSFFGVTLGLFDYLRICLRLMAPYGGVSKPCAATSPATRVVVSDLPNGFIYGIGVPELGATIWRAIIPQCWQSKLARSFPIRCSRSGEPIRRLSFSLV